MEYFEKLKHLVELLQTGAITQSEFDALKMQLVNASGSATPKLQQIIHTGSLTITFNGVWMLIDTTIKLFVNDKLHSTHSLKKGFSVILPIENSSIKITIENAGRGDVFTLTDLDINKSYSAEVTFSRAWGKFDDIKLT
jgi:hypothetical protein